MYRYQAACQQADADAATLSNVRAKRESAANAWTRMAKRIEHTNALRKEERQAAALKKRLLTE